MTDLDKYLIMLKSPKASVRYDACEELRVAKESSPEVISALEAATRDEDKYVAERASQALGAEVHQQMAIQMGRSLPILEKEPVPGVVPEPEQHGRKVNRLAIASLVLSISAILIVYLSFSTAVGIGFSEPPRPTFMEILGIVVIGGFFIGFLLGLAGVTTSIFACWQIIKKRMHKIDLAMAILGYILGFFVCSLYVLIIIVQLTI